ncbi:fimbrial protein [Stenotrophomonas maltophilia]|uniref:fimbrial protein n=1 Tax=Stenotrophomonas maltophilia TaxID=40324 RepID=UPI0015DEFF99|nr:fimbrial protein [Stenotrophomonas maltophilia]MBA0446637.1 fimbrial protein [Stenotrophomonas maltophilia]
MNVVALRSATLVALVAVAPTVLADTATLTISGRVLPGTCVMNAPAMTLDPIKANELSQGDNQIKAGRLDFSGCVGVTKAKLSFSGTAADGDAARWKNTADTDPAEGVSIALLAGTTGSTYLKDGDTGIEVVVTGATASYALRAGYYLPTLGAITAGAVQADITVTADYE